MTLYHYDAGGNFTGSSSDTPPGCGCGAWGCLALVIVAGLVICKVGSVLLEELPSWVPDAAGWAFALISIGLPIGIMTWMTVSAKSTSECWRVTVLWCGWGLLLLLSWPAGWIAPGTLLFMGIACGWLELLTRSSESRRWTIALWCVWGLLMLLYGLILVREIMNNVISDDLGRELILLLPGR